VYFTVNYSSLQSRLNYSFKDSVLLTTALRHKSAGKPNNERLEFLGDALLNAIVADTLYADSSLSEGEMTARRSALVQGKTLSEVALEIDLGSHLELGMGERKGAVRASILEDALEALIGAVYLDSDFNTCKQVVTGLLQRRIQRLKGSSSKDSKTALQELMQAEKLDLPEYHREAEQGPDHQRTFTVRCSVNLYNLSATATAGSRRLAEQLAAEKVLEKIKQQTDC